jgi:hypothetical protein
MRDLMIGGGVIAVLAAGAFLLGRRIALRRSKRMAAWSVVAVSVAVGLYVYLLQGTLILARVLPFSNLIVLGNAIPLGIGFLAGIVSGRGDVRRWRKVALCLALFGLAVFAVLKQVVVSPPPSQDRWTRNGVCMQTSHVSCSAAAAASLLRAHDIDAGEGEMIDLCLTGKTGTPSVGLYRGLKLKTAGTPFRVEVIHSDVDRLLAEDRWPVLLLVKLERGAGVDPRYEHDWGWTPGVGHAVVIFGRVGEDRLDVGDPSVGREQWLVRDLRVLWHGRGLRLALLARGAGIGLRERVGRRRGRANCRTAALARGAIGSTRSLQTPLADNSRWPRQPYCVEFVLVGRLDRRCRRMSIGMGQSGAGG